MQEKLNHLIRWRLVGPSPKQQRETAPQWAKRTVGLGLTPVCSLRSRSHSTLSQL